MGRRLKDRLSDHLAQLFVGRAAELARFAGALEGATPVVLVHGPGGIGKTTLLHAMAAEARQRKFGVTWVDLRHVAPEPAALVDALAEALGMAADVERSLPAVLARLGHQPRRVLVLDTLEHLTALGPWLRTAVLAELPAETVVVVSGRGAPDASWWTDPAWREGTLRLGLAPLTSAEATALLGRRGVPSPARGDLAALGHGHPLTLALLADLWRAERRVPERLGTGILRALAERFVDLAPSAGHRAALEVASVARFTRAGLLAQTLGVPAEEADAWMTWLSGLGFLEHSPRGLFPHDLVRDAVSTAMTARDPALALQRREAVSRALLRDAARAKPLEAGALGFEALFPHRDERFVTDFVDFGAWLTAVRAQPADTEGILALAAAELSPARRAVLRHWLRRPEAAVAYVVRAPGTGKITAVSVTVDLSAVTPADRRADPLLAALAQELGPATTDRVDLMSRLQFASGGILERRAEANAIQACMIMQWLGRRDLHRSAVALEHPERWAPFCGALGMVQRAATDTADGVTTGVFARDWVSHPMGGRRTTPAPPSPQPPGPPAPVDDAPMDAAAFDGAVLQALHDWLDPAALSHNPLARSRWVTAQATAGEAPHATLRRLIRAAADALGAHPRGKRFHRALVVTYLEPAGTQERAAEALQLAFGTYRYQRATAVRRLCERLRRDAGLA